MESQGPRVRFSHIRPNQPYNREVSFLWEPGQVIVELLYRPDKGLVFVAHGRSDGVDGYTPLPWIEAYARAGAIRLPSKTEDYGSLDQLADQVRSFIHRYFDCEATFESLATLYVLHTWVYERFHAVPYLRFLGPPGTGKTRATETIGALCYHPLTIAGSVTAAPMYRLIEATGGTVLFDEADLRDTEVGADVVKVLTCGYQRRLPVSRMEKVGNRWVPKLYEVFGPKIINGRKRFKDEAVETRCLSYTPTATTRTDIPVQLSDAFQEEAERIQNRALSWRFKVLDSLKPSTRHVGGVSRRMNQIIQPLLTIVDLMGQSMGNRYRSDLLRFAQQAEQQASEVRYESVEAAIVRALSDFDQRGQQPTCKELCDVVLMAEADNDPKLDLWLNPKKMSGILRSLGFFTRHTKTGAVVLSNKKRLRGLEEQYGVEQPSPQASPQPSPEVTV